MADSDDTSANKDVPPWLQPVPEGDDETSFFVANRKTIITASVAAVLFAVFAGAIVVLYQDAPSEGPKHVVADAGPVKERPTEAGGLQVDHQDKAVLEIGDGETAKARIEIGEQPEQPVDEIPDLPAEEPDDVPAAPEGTQDTIGDLAEAAAKPAETSVQTAPAPAAPAPAAPKAPESAATTGFRVQLGAYGSETSAATAWRTLKGKFPRQLGDLEPVYVPVQSGDRTLYRLRVGPVDTRSRADEICISLRAQDQACFVAGS